MNIDLTSTYEDGLAKLNTWNSRYSSFELPHKIVLNIFYRKFTIDSMFERALNMHCATWDEGYERIMNLYGQVAAAEVHSNLEDWISQDIRVGAQRFSDFHQFIENARSGSEHGLAPIQYTYLLHRVLDELVVTWLAFTTTGLSPIDSITRLTNFEIETGQIDNYEKIESILDQLGAENELRKHML